MAIKFIVFWSVTPCSLVYITNMEPPASTLKVADVMDEAGSPTKHNGVISVVSVISVVRKRYCVNETERYQNCIYH
jgi:hypothetical protein